MEKIIKKTPVPIAGLMLALGATGNLVASYGILYKSILGSISAIIFLLLLLKVFVNTKDVIENLENPVIASVAPTFSMGIMVLATYMKASSPSIAFGFWIVGLLTHCLLIIYVTKKFILNFDIKKIFPSYFVVYVGIVVGSVTAPAFNAAGLGRLLFWFGFLCYLVLLPIVIYRVFAVKSIPEPALPTITIFSAPASLCLAGYMSSFQEKNISMVWLLTLLSLIMFFAVLLYMPKMLKLKFYPSYSAFTFPCVISAIAIKKTNAFLISTKQGMPALKYLVKFEELFAVAIVIYVLIRYINFIFINNPVKSNILVNDKRS